MFSCTTNLVWKCCSHSHASRSSWVSLCMLHVVNGYFSILEGVVMAARHCFRFPWSCICRVLAEMICRVPRFRLIFTMKRFHGVATLKLMPRGLRFFVAGALAAHLKTSFGFYSHSCYVLFILWYPNHFLFNYPLHSVG